MLRPLNIRKWLAKKRPLLTKEIAHKRYHWAKRHRDWTVDDWLKVIFSDECSVERGASHRRKYVFRSTGQQFDRDKVTSYDKSKDIRVMVRAAILDDGMSDLLVLRRDLEAKRQGYSANSHLQVPRDGLLPIYNRNHIYQQDGAPIHTAKKNRENPSKNTRLDC